MFDRDDLQMNSYGEIQIKEYYGIGSSDYNWKTLISVGQGANGCRDELLRLILNAVSN